MPSDKSISTWEQVFRSAAPLRTIFDAFAERHRGELPSLGVINGSEFSTILGMAMIIERLDRIAVAAEQTARLLQAKR